MKLIVYPNKILRQKSKIVSLPLSSGNIKLAESMIKCVDDSQKENNKHRQAVGIAAVQFGYLKRMFYVNIKKDDKETFKDLLINPVVVAEGVVSMSIQEGEGCLSISKDSNNFQGLVHRKAKIIIKGYSYFQKKEVEYSKFGYSAIVIQHEIDHLNGILFIDRIDQKNKWEPQKNEILI